MWNLLTKVALAAILITSTGARAAEVPNTRTGRATPLLRVIDGDTLQYGRAKVRAVGYDTPEIRGKCQAEKDLALKAKARFQELVTAPNRFGLKWAKGKDEFGRGLATFYSNGRPVAPVLIQEGLAHAYDHRTGRTPWC